jgi:glycosyltransferase involved in cell wall biosynthesis
MNRPSISAIIVNHNRGKLAATALKDALSQTVPFDEIIYMDDASTDDSLEYVKKLKSKKKVRLFINETRLGVTKNSIAGLEMARCEYVFFMSSDDRYSHNVVSIAKSAISRDCSTKMICGCATVSGQQRKTHLFNLNVKVGYTDPEAVIQYADQGLFTFFGGANVMCRDTIVKTGALNSDFEWYADWLLYFMIGFSERIYITRDVLTTQTHNQNSFSTGAKKTVPRVRTTLRIIRFIKHKNPDLFSVFKVTATVPLPSPALLLAVILDADTRNFCSSKFVYRCMVFYLFRYLSTLTPRKAHRRVRSMLKV